MEKLKELRIKNNYTNDEMAQMLGITKPFYWLIENNQRRLYYFMAVKIANIFNMKPDDIFYEDTVRDLKNKETD